jgi:hypothetical protein
MLAFACAPPLASQEWRVDLLGGRDHLQQGPTSSGSSSLLVGVRALGTERWGGLFAGLPVEEGQAGWGAALGSARLWAGRGTLRLGADLSGQFFVQAERAGSDGGGGLGALPPVVPPNPRLPMRDEDGPSRGWGTSGEAMAVVQFRPGPLLFEVRSGAAHYRHAFDDASLERTLPQLHLTGRVIPDPALLLRAEVRRYWADESGLTRLDATVLRALGPTTVWAALGRWVEGPVEGTPWAAGVSLEVGTRATLQASARREPYEPLYLTPDRTTWNAGVSLAFGRPPVPRAPIPDRYEGGVATLALPASEADDAPRIAGDFNQWQPAPMVREGSHWIFRVRLEPGVYNYAFVTEDGNWFVPESVPGRKPDGFGGHVAVLVVAGA